MTNKDILLGLAARIDQIYVELEAFGKKPDISLSASHQAGVAQYSVRSASRQLQVLAKMVGD